ncbi:MAG: GNAT family N-acetyltransferase, partial [Gammaproteobacteria bacterium]|nr:GNAT family N-acetyltransferase [Gammaproteobacteria bacterium]
LKKPVKRINMEEFSQLQPHLEFARQSGIRLPILLQGSNALALRTIQWLSETFSLNELACLTDFPDYNALANAKPEYIVGQEFSAAFCVIDQQTNFNLLAALTGTIKGGGICVFFISQTSAINNRFLTRLLALLNKHSAIKATETTNGLKLDTLYSPTLLSDSSQEGFAQQQAAIQAIMDLASHEQAQALFLTAARGRGKSAALGMACANLQNNGIRNIVITAPSRASAKVIYKHFTQARPDADLKFLPPDELLQTLPNIDLLIIDEAAAIPGPMLKQLSQHYKTIVFATTTDGYEGSGQGFSIRFKPFLKKLFKDFTEIHLQHPIRWTSQDLLEPLCNKLFLLDARPANLDTNTDLSQCEFSPLSREHILNENKLTEIIGLLKLAHYRTRPSDILQLINNSEIQLFACTLNSQLAGIALCLPEGPVEPSLIPAIYQGRRRPKGNIIPQSLIYNLGITDIKDMRFLRIMRIAIHPVIQRHKLGSQLITFIENIARDQHFSTIGSSFGGTEETVSFWHSLDYLILRTGAQEKASSGARSALILKALQEEYRQAIADLHQQYLQHNHYQQQLEKLAQTQTLNEKTVCQLTPQIPAAKDWQIAYSYAFHNRRLEDCQMALHTIICHAIKQTGTTTKNFDLLIDGLLKLKSAQKLKLQYKLTGKKQLDMALKTQTAKLIIAFADKATKTNILNNPLNH